MTTFGLTDRRLLKVGGIRISVRSVTAIALVGKAISSSLPLAGAEMGTAYTYRRFQRHHTDGVTAAWVLTVSGVASTVSFAVIVSAAAIATDNLGVILAGLAVTILTVLAVAAMAIRRPALLGRIEWAAIRGLRLGQRIMRRPRGQTDKAVKEVIARLSALRVNRRDVIYIALTSSVNWIGDILCLAFAVAALEKSLPWPDVVLAWAAGSAASSLQLTPGGLGAVEAALTSALVVTGLHPGDAAAVALTYRAMSYWAPTLTGWVVLGTQRHTPSAGTTARARFAAQELLSQSPRTSGAPNLTRTPCVRDCSQAGCTTPARLVGSLGRLGWASPGRWRHRLSHRHHRIHSTGTVAAAGTTPIVVIAVRWPKV